MGGKGQEARSRVAPNDRDRGLLELKASARSGATLPVDRDGEEYTLLSRRCPPLPSYTGLVEQAEEGKIGIACSGGGIRSAAFSLGALQVLQQSGKLQEASYLAGVSGGSYIAAAFSMVRKRWSRTAAAEAAREAEREERRRSTRLGGSTTPTLTLSTPSTLRFSLARPRSSTCAIAAHIWRQARSA